MARIPKKKKSVAPDGFPEKEWNKLPDAWRSSADSKQTDELEKDLIKAVRSMTHTSADLRNDSKILSIQEQLKELKSMYTEVIALESAKIKYIIYLFNTRGIPVSTDIKAGDLDENAA
jgi:hypothetical protein